MLRCGWLPECPDLLFAESNRRWPCAAFVRRRVVPRPHGDTWRMQVSSPQKVRAAVAAAAATEAAAGGAAQPLPNPMHLRTDGAGTVLEGVAPGVGSAGAAAAGGTAEDTQVIEVVDPGR